MPVPFAELKGSPRESYTEDSIKARREVIVPWGQRYNAVNELLGTGLFPGGAFLTQYPTLLAMFVVGLDVKPFHDDITPTDFSSASMATALQRYNNFAQLSIEYELLDGKEEEEEEEEEDPETWLSYSIDGSADGLVIPGRGLYWTGAATGPIAEDDISVVKRVPIMEHRLEWHRVVNPPMDAIRDKIGSINRFGFLGAEVGTLLFDSFSLNREFTLQGFLDDRKVKAWKLTYLFREQVIKEDERVVTWNELYKSTPEDQAGWHEVIDADGNNPYKSEIMAPLFMQEEGHKLPDLRTIVPE